MKELWQRYAGRFNALTLRERVSVFAAAMVAIFALAYTQMLEPEWARQKRLSSAISQKQVEMRAFEAQVTKMVASRAQDPDRAERERLARLRTELGVLDSRITSEERKFTAPAQMRAVVAGLLARSRGVTLVEMKTLSAATSSTRPKPAAAKPTDGKAPEKPAAAERLIYRHGLELTVTGSYLDLLAYARELEKLPTQLYWGTLELDAAAYPRVSMRLTVYTLSLDPTWLSV